MPGVAIAQELMTPSTDTAAVNEQHRFLGHHVLQGPNYVDSMQTGSSLPLAGLEDILAKLIAPADGLITPSGIRFAASFGVRF